VFFQRLNPDRDSMIAQQNKARQAGGIFLDGKKMHVCPSQRNAPNERQNHE
jgi:hypothetical protein